MTQKIKFDPGFAPLVIDSIQQLGYTYYSFSAISNIKLKKLNFLPTYKKIEKYLKTNMAFYLGCLMWAKYISQFENCEIEGNKLLNEKCEEEEYTGEINFLIDLVEKQLPRDLKYFLNKNTEPNGQYSVILKTYKEFLILNNGFCACANTSDIKLPQNLKELNKEELENLNSLIKTAIDEKNVDKLLDSYGTVF